MEDTLDVTRACVLSNTEWLPWSVDMIIIMVVPFSLWAMVKAFRARSNPREVMRVLGFFGAMAPLAVLLGFAGALEEMITVCNKIAAMSGNYHPAYVADGLGLSLMSVYAGLLVAAFVVGMKAILAYWLLPSRSAEGEESPPGSPTGS